MNYKFLYLVLLLIPSFASVPEVLHAQPVANRGILDLRTISIGRDTQIELNGEWKLYRDQLIPPTETARSLPDLVAFPHLWSESEEMSAYGIATYQLTVLLPQNAPLLGLTIPDMYTAYKLYANDQLIAKNGVVGEVRSEHIPKWRPLTVPLHTLEGTELEITLLISNFSHSKGGVRLPIVLGDAKSLQLNRETEIGYAYLLTGALLMAALFFLGLYSFGKNENPILFFALFCLTYSYRIIGTELYPLHLLLPDLPWLLTVKLEYFSLFFSALLFGLYIHHLYPEESYRKLVNGFSLTFGLFSASAIALPAYYFTLLLYPFFILLALYFIYAVYIFVAARVNERAGSGFGLAGMAVILIIFVFDLLEYLQIADENLLITFTGYILFFFLQSLTLSNRFAYTLYKAKEHAEAASVAKTHFLSTMGHELRTPLNAVIGLSELLLDSKSEEEKTQFATTIKKSGESLLGIINNILDFTKIEADEIEFEYKATYIPSLLADTIKMLGTLADPDKVSLSFRFDDSLSTYVNTDPVRLRQILINLIGNAIKFTDEGHISIQVTTTESISDKGQILFIIKDSGIGIPTEKMDLLFDRFSQIETDRNRKYGGTGLGLAISKRLIESMGGRIWVQSDEGKGTTFYFTLEAPAISDDKVTELEAERTSDEEGAIRNDLNILVVEDNLVNQKVVLKVLERIGFDASIANNGYEAIEIVQQQKFDLIFMDMEMPEIDGIEATERIKSMQELSYNPVIIAMTANATTEDKARCFEAGMQDFISKPITLQTTRDVLVKWFSERQLSV